MISSAEGTGKARRSRVPVTLSNVAKLLGGVAGIFYAIWFVMLVVERFRIDVLLWIVPVVGALVALVRPLIGGTLLVAGGIGIWLWSLSNEGGVTAAGFAYLVLPAVTTGGLLLVAGIRQRSRT